MASFLSFKRVKSSSPRRCTNVKLWWTPHFCCSVIFCNITRCPSASSPSLFFLVTMKTLVNDPRERKKFDASVLRYRVFTRHIRRMLYLGGVLQDRTRSATWSYITGLLVFLTCFSQCVFMINFCRNLTNNLVLFAKCFGLVCSIIGPLLMVTQLCNILSWYCMECMQYPIVRNVRVETLPANFIAYSIILVYYFILYSIQSSVGNSGIAILTYFSFLWSWRLK